MKQELTAYNTLQLRGEQIMSYYDPFGRYYRAQQPSQRRTMGQTDPRRQQPTLEDYHKLLESHQKLQSEREELAKQLEATQEALRQQTRKAIDLNEALHEAQQEVEQLHGELTTLAERQDNDEWQERYLRLQAETENYRRRLEQRSLAEVSKQKNQILEDMLSLADHLEMALNHLDRPIDGTPDPSGVGMGFRQNLEATLRSFLETLRKHGVQPIEPLGEPFDPERHEALGHIEAENVPEDHVAAVVRTGYLVDEQLLRPARVMVSRGS
jgi:molecular chaperone GrpE